MKFKIHQFDPVIYPRLLFVAIGVPVEELKKHLSISLKDEDYIKSNPKGFSGICFPVTGIENKQKGILAYFPSNKISVDDIAHESVHVADYIFEEIGSYGQEFSDKNEPYAYLVGWSAGCIDKVKRNKFD